MSVITACAGSFFQIILTMTCVKDIVFFSINFVYNIALLCLGHNKAINSYSKFLFSYRHYKLQCQILHTRIIDLDEE